MNRIYRTLWSVVTQSWQAVPETAKTAGKKSKSSAGGVVASVALGFTLSGVAHAQAPPAINQLPTGGTVARGAATISQTATAQAAAMVVNQSSQRAVINWSTFNLGSAASINFVQPNAQAVTLNRVNDSNPSQIFGRITANGQVFLTNANGVYFSPTSSVDVGAITATTHSISDDNFMSGKYVFERNGATGKVVNEGNITAALGGYVALLAPEVQNAGVVVARAGTVAMAAGEVITLTVDGAGSLAGMTTTASAIAALVENKLAVLAPDGQIILSAIALDKLQAGVVKNSGSLEANSLVNKGGKIVLEGDHIVMDRNSKIEAKGRTGGGTVLVGGDWQGSGDMRQATKVMMEQGASIDASATDQGDGGKVVLWSDVHNADSMTRANGSIKAEAGPNGGNGGQVETSGQYLNVDNIQVSTNAAQGEAGTWLLDPSDITISSGSDASIGYAFVSPTGTYTPSASAASSVVNVTTLQNNLANNNVTITSTNATTAGTGTGNITVASDITWTSVKTLTLTAAGSISGTGTINGGGSVIFNQGADSTYSGNIATAGIQKNGAYTLTLTGTMTNTGYTSVNAGILKLGSSTSISPNATSVIVNSGASIDLNGQTISSVPTINITGSGVTVGGVNLGALMNSSATAATLNLKSVVQAWAGDSLILANYGAINLSNTLANANSLSANGLTYAITLGGTTGGSVTGAIMSNVGASGLQILNKVDSGTWAFNNTQFGTTLNVNAGTVRLDSATALYSAGTGKGTYTVASGATLDLNGFNQSSTTGSKLTLNGTGVNGVGALVNSSTNSAAYAGSIALGSDATVSATSGAINFSTSANALTGAYRLTLAGPGGGSIANKFTTSGTALTIQDAGTWALSGVNSYTGSTNITGGTLRIDAAAAWPATSAVSLSSGATLAFNLSSGTSIGAAGATNVISSATPGAGTISSLTTQTTVNLSGTNLSGYSGTFSAAVNETVTPIIAKMVLPSSPDLTNITFNVNTTGFQVSFTPNQVFTWGGTATGGTPLLKLNGALVTSGSPVLGAMLTLNTGDVTIGPGAYWSLTNAGTTYYMGASNSNANYTLTGTATAAVYYGQTAVHTGVLSGTGTLEVNTNAVIGGAAVTAGGSLTLASGGAVNTYSGGTQLTAGKLKAGSSTAFGTGDISVASGSVIDLNGQIMTSTGGLTLNGTGISSSGALMNGATTAATYAGLLTLAGSTTIISGSSSGSIALTNTGSITGSGYALTLSGTAGGSIASIIDTGTGTLTQVGTGTWALSGANTYSGVTTISSGSTLAIGTGGTTGSVAGSITDNGTLVINRSDTATLANTISGSGVLKQSGTGTVIVTGNNSYSGGTTLTAGVLNLGSANAIGTSGTISFGGGALQYSASNYTTDYSSRFGATSQTYKIDTNGYDITLASALGAGTLTKLGSGTLILTGSDTSITTITLSAGNLQVGNGGTTGSLLATNSMTVTTSANTSLIFNRSDTITYSSLTLSGPGGLTQAGTGTLAFSGGTSTKAYTGTTYVKTGVLDFGSYGGNSSPGPSLIIDAGARFNYAAAMTFGSLSGAGTLYTGNGSTLTIGGNNTDTEFSGVFLGTGTTNTGPVIAKQGTGKFTYSGNSGIDFRGYTANAGVIQVGTGGTSGSLGATLTFNGGTFAINHSDNLTLTSLSGSTGTFNLIGTGTTTIACSCGGFGGTTNLMAGTLLLSPPSVTNAMYSVPGYFVFSGGTLKLSANDKTDYSSHFSTAANQNYSIDTNGQTVTFATALTSSGGTLTKLGSGTLILSGANTYTGQTTVSAGTLQVGDGTVSTTSAKLGTGSVSVNGDLFFYHYGATTLSAIAPITGAISGTGNVTVMSTGTLNVDKDITLTGAGSSIKVLAGSNSAANASLLSDLTLTNTITTSDTGTIDIFAGSPTVATANGATSVLNSHMAGAIGSLQYKVYNATKASLDTAVAGTRSFYYRVQPTITVSGITVANKTYDGTTNANVTGSPSATTTTDEAGQTLSVAFATSNFANANVGNGKAVTLSGISLVNAAWNITGLNATGSSTANITAKTLTVSGTTVANKIYDRNTTATLSGGSLIGVVSGDTVTLTQAGSFVSANTGTGITVNAADVLGGTSASNYALTQPTGLSADITPKALTVINTVVNSKTYSGTTSATLINGSLSGVITGDASTLTLTQIGTFATANAGIGIAVTAADVLGGASANNYTLTQPTGLTGTINKANAVVTASSGSVTYDGLAHSVSGFTAAGLVNSETASVLTGVTAGTSGTNAGTYTSTASGTDTNYNLTFVNGALTIGKAHLTVTAGNASKTYGDANPTLSATVSGFVNGETLGTSGVSGSGAATTTATALTGAGTATITAGAGTLTASNYDFTNLVNGTLTINKAHLTVTADNASRTYGDANPLLGTTVSGFVNGQILGTSGVTGAGAATTTADALTGAGTATITAGAGTLAASNYDFTNLVNGTLTINKANAIVTANSSNVTYNGITRTVSGFTVSTLKNNETASVLTGVTTSGGTGTNAGTYPLIAAGDAANYNLTFVDGALTIGKAHLTVTASSDTRTYGAANPTLTATVTGFVNGESAPNLGSGGITWGGGVLSINTAGISGATALSTTATNTTGVGSVPITAAIGTLAAANYDFTFVNGALNITPAPLSVVLGSQTKVYDGTTNASLTSSSYTLTGFANGEGATVTQTQGTYNNPNVLNATTVTTSLAAGNFAANAGTSLSNYVLPTTASSAGSITPASLSATGTKTYDGSVNFDGTALTVAGVHGETFAASGTGTMSSKNVQSNQTLSSIAGLSLTGNGGALASNYVPLSTADTQVSVTPRAVNLNAPSATKTYDSTTLYQASSSDLTVLSNQLVGGDRVTAAEVVYSNKDAGTGKRVILNNVTISDDNGGNNYTVGKVDVTTGVINKAPLTVSVVSDARFVTQSDAVGYAGVVYNGLVGGETAAVLTPGTISRTRAVNVNTNNDNSAGQYNGVLHATNWSSNNYDISYIAGNYTIAGAHTLLVQVPTASTTYGTAATYAPTAQYLLEVSPNNFQVVNLTPTVNGNAVSVNDGVGGQASFNINAIGAVLSGAGNVRAGGYNLEAGNLNKTGDNFTNFVMTGGLTVTPKILNNNLGVQAITKVYDGSASISNFGLTFNQPTAGVATNDTVTLLGSGSFDDRHVGTNKTVSLSLGLSGADAANYALASPSLSANIGQITQLASVTYTGATNGNWSDPNNWAGGALPDRNNVAQVVIPTGKTVVYYSDQVGTIGSTLAVNGAVRFSSSNAFTLANTVSGTGNLEQRGTGMLTVSGSNTNFSGNLDIDAYSATISNAQALGTGHVVANGGHLSVSAGLTLPSLRVDGSVILDTAIKTTGDQTYNGALTFLSSGTAQAPNFVSDTGNVSFESTVSAGLGAMTAQRSLFVSAPNGTVLFNDQVGRMVQGLDYNTQYLTSGVNDTSPYALSVSAQTIKLFGDVTTFDSQTYDGAVRVGTNGTNGHTRLLVSMDPTITFKGTVDDADPTGKVNGLDVRAISLAQIASNAAVPTITFESDVGGVSPLATLRLATGIQNSAAGALVTEVKTDDASRRDVHYKGDIILKGDLTVGDAPLMIAEQLLVPNASQTLTWYTGTPDFRLRLPALGGASTIPTNLQLVQWGQTNNGGSSNGGSSSASTTEDTSEAGRQWEMAHRTHAHAAKVVADNAAIDAMNNPPERVIADVQVGNESVLPKTPTSQGMYVQVREFAPETLDAQKPFIYQLPADTFVHSSEKERIKLSATTGNGANLPRWVKFSAKDRTLSGKPPKWVKSLDVKVMATDRQGARATTRVRLVFANGSGS